MPTQKTAPSDFARSTNGAGKKPARRERNRLRAKDLSQSRIREVKRDFDISRSTLETAQNHILPRAEAVDAVLMRHSDELVTVRQELNELRRQVGVECGPYLIARSAA